MGKKTTRWYYALALVFLSTFTWAQSISGTIKDKTGQGLPGANVSVKERPGVGAIADFDGNYVLNNLKPGKVTLVFSFIGYESQSVPVDIAAVGNRVVDVVLAESTNQLDEAVVVGYGVQRRRDVTGSIVSLSSKSITETPTQSFEQAIQGKAPGVQVITGSGLAGSASVIRIRGIASISAAGDPLYVIDGIPITQDYFLRGNGGAMNNNPLATINPNDIESVEVLKDAAATAIYGSRGSNGVILITTKRGKRGGLQFNFTSNVGFSQPTARPEMLNGPEYLQLYREAWINDGNIGTPTGLQGGLSWSEAQRYNTDWVDRTIGTGVKHNYDFSVQKGSKDYNFYAGLSYNYNGSYLIGNSYERLAGRFNGDFRLSDKLKLSVGTTLARGDNNRIDAAWSGGLGAAMSTALPYFPVYWDRDVYTVDPGSGDSTLVHRVGDYWLEAGVGNNPVANRELKTWRQREVRSISTAQLTYSPIKNLNIVYSASYDYMTNTEDLFFQRQWLTKVEGQADTAITGGRAERYPFFTRNFNNFLTASYDYRLDENQDFTFLLGTEFQQRTGGSRAIRTQTGQTNSVTNVEGPFYDVDDLQNNVPFDTLTEFAPERFMSYFGRVNWKYKNKYLAQAVLRVDGSSKFGPQNRFGFFPSLGLGWVMSEEDFLSNHRFINYMKLRSSIGYSGNSNLPADRFRSLYQLGANAYNGQPSRYIVNPENPDLQWESSRIFDMGLEFGLFDDRITGDIAYYDKYTTGVFIGVQLPRIIGYGTNTFFDNIATISNRGVELSLKSNNITTKNFSWTTSFNIARNVNTLVDLGGYSEDAVSGGTNDTRTVVGQPVGTNYLVRFSRVDPDNGAPIYLDLDGNETYNWDPADRVAVGSVLPDAIGGFSNDFRYKNWDLSFLFVYTLGGDIYDSSSKRQLGPMDEWNKTPLIYDRWQRPGDEATYPRLTRDFENLGANTPWINTDLWLHDGSYLRLRQVILGYNLPQSALKRMKVRSLRITFTGTNLLTFTRYPGLDPEIARDFENAADRNMSTNITYLTPPQEQTFMLGINLGF